MENLKAGICPPFLFLNSMLSHVDGKVVNDAGIGAFHRDVAQVVFTVDDDGESCDVVYPVVVFVVLESDFPFGAK